jgi:hypothetical protein
MGRMRTEIVREQKLKKLSGTEKQEIDLIRLWRKLHGEQLRDLCSDLMTDETGGTCSKRSAEGEEYIEALNNL